MGGHIINARSAFSLFDLAPDLFLWAKVTDSLRQESAGTTAVAALDDPVGFAADLSGNRNHLTNATAGERFLYKPDGIATGIASIRSDGTDDHLFRTDAIGLTGTDTPYSLLVSGIIRSNLDATRNILGAGSSASNNPIITLGTTSTPQYIQQRRDDSNVIVTTLSGTPVKDAKVVIEVYFAGTTVTTVVNGSAIQTDVSQNVGALTLDRFSIGALLRAAASSFISFDYRMVLVVAGRVLSATEQNSSRSLAIHDIGGVG